MARVNEHILFGALAMFVSMAPPALAQTVSCPLINDGDYTLASSPKQKFPLRWSQSNIASIMIGAAKDADEGEFNVNSDGSPRAYHLLDPEGLNYALNDMYSGGVRVWDNGEEVDLDEKGLSKQRKSARIKQYYAVFRRWVAENEGFGAEPSQYKANDDKQFKVGGAYANGLDEPRVRSIREALEDAMAVSVPERASRHKSDDMTDYNCVACRTTSCRVCFKKDIVAFEGGVPCIRKAGRYKGFLVNQTALDKDAGNSADPENGEDNTCGVKSDLDPVKLPGIVLPGGKLKPDGIDGMTAQRGDVVVGYNPKSRRWVFGIVSDSGPGYKFGEASIAFNRVLGVGYDAWPDSSLPQSYRGSLLRQEYQPARPIYLLVLPGTKKHFEKWPHTDHAYDFSPETVARIGHELFLKWAGTSDLQAARDIYRACVSTIRLKQ